MPSSVSEPARNGSAFESLADPNAWSWVEAAEDPIAATVQEPIVRCGPADVITESGGLEISTTNCNYVLLEQPLAQALDAGSQLRVVVWWQRLASTSPAQGHLSLTVDESEIWTRAIDIPGPADVADDIVRLDQTYAAGSRLQFHLRNHGYNTWNLNRIEAQSP